MVAYRRPQNIQNFLVRAQLPPQTPTNRRTRGTSTCSNNCWLCFTDDAIIEGDTFSSPHVPGKVFHIQHHYDCESTNIIYLSTCALCGEVAVGYSTDKLKTRASLYKTNICKGLIDNPRLNAWEQHFCQESHRTTSDLDRNSLLRRHGWPHFRIQVIDGVHDPDLPARHAESVLIAMEYEWQQRLNVKIQTRRARNPYGFHVNRPPVTEGKSTPAKPTTPSTSTPPKAP